MKSLIVILIILMFAATIGAEPFLVSDPQEGIEEHLFTCGSYSVVTPAETDGSFKYDFATWVGGHGWFDCNVKSRVKYEVVDMLTGNASQAIQEGLPAEVRIKIPNKNAASNYQVSEWLKRSGD